MEYEDPRLTTKLKVLVFDLGGVLLKLNSPAETFDLEWTEADFLDRWIVSDAVREFERGAIDAQVFADRIVVETGLPYNGGEFLQRFRGWPDALFDDVTAILDSVAGDFKTALLSNTNALHWHENALADVLTNFDKTFLSFETGLLKPDRNAYADVWRHYGCKADEIAFFDDNPVNVVAAADFGFNSLLTRGTDDLQRNLASLGIVI